jgi:nucleoside-diphosphate-sugar epimerase
MAVTGGTGFVGSHLLEQLLRRGHQVRALVRSVAKTKALGLEGVEWLPGSLDDQSALRRLVAGVDVIFHVAGVVAARDEAEFLAVNRDGTSRLLRAAQDTDARFILVSSLSAGGPAERGAPLRGAEPPRPVTSYGRSKLAAEAAVVASGLPWTVIRPPAVYGPRDTEFLRLFRAVRFGVAPVFGDGSQELSLIFGPDLAEALALAGESPAAAGRTYYAAHPVLVTAAHLVRSIADAVGSKALLIRIPQGVARVVLQVTGAAASLAGRATTLSPAKADEFFRPAWTCDPSELTTDTGWAASHDLETGLRKTAAWYRKEGWL